MFMRRIKLQNILSFGPDAQELELGPLNVLIGPNGSGKSNLIEVMGLLRAAPRDLTTPIIQGGGVGNWIWRGEPEAPSAYVDAVLHTPFGDKDLRHSLTFTEKQHRFELSEELIANETPYSGPDQPYLYFDRARGKSLVNIKVYVEGGGDGRELRAKCRKGFGDFFHSAGMAGHMPKVIACGSRQRAYEKFQAALHWV